MPESRLTIVRLNLLAIMPYPIACGRKATAAVFDGQFVRKLPHEIQAKARRQLKLIDATSKVEELRVPPGNRLELLSGNRAAQWSIRINDQWRICFKWEDGHARDVEIVDYH